MSIKERHYGGVKLILVMEKNLSNLFTTLNLSDIMMK